MFVMSVMTRAGPGKGLSFCHLSVTVPLPRYDKALAVELGIASSRAATPTMLIRELPHLHLDGNPHGQSVVGRNSEGYLGCRKLLSIQPRLQRARRMRVTAKSEWRVPEMR